METNSQALGTCVISQYVSTTAVEALFTASQFTDNYIIIALDNGEINVFDIYGTRKRMLSSSGGAVWALAVQGDMLASGGTDGLIEIWDLATGEHQQTLQGHTSTVRALVILSGSKRIISASRDTKIRVWDVVDGTCTHVLAAHTGTVRNLALSNSENLLVSGSQDGTACVWRITDDEVQLLHILRGHEGVIFSVAFARDEDSKVVTVGLDTSVRVWNPKDGKCLAILRGHSTVVTRVLVVGSKLVTSDGLGCIYIWAIKDPPEPIHRLEMHHASVISLDSSGKTIVSGSADGAVRLGDLESGQLLGQIVGDATAVYKVGFLEDGRVALVAYRDGKVIMEIWDIN
ncbi:WD40 repeat-like protein [Stipitochalara longipes BDJ]|nr:WD40 repeat-like protein [Stipitochalara longipes BDJ]